MKVKMNRIAVTYIIFLALLSVFAYSIGLVDHNALMAGVFVTPAAGAFTAIAVLVSDILGKDWYSDWR